MESSKKDAQDEKPLPTTELNDAEVKDEANGEETDVVVAADDGKLGEDERHAAHTVLDNVLAFREADGYDPTKVFQRKVNKRMHPDYYDVIKDPMAFSTMKQKLQAKEYETFSQFVKDLYLISHNAQVYNRPSAGAYQDALTVRSVVTKELQKVVEQDGIPAEAIVPPELGDLPPVEDSPAPGDDDADDDDDDDEDEEEEEPDDSDDDGARRRKKRGSRSTAAISKRESIAGKDDDAKDANERKKRGRPPRVDTPMEARIKAVIKGLRKPKSSNGDLKIINFEKLPDKGMMPEYYAEVKRPMAMDTIKKYAKRKKYTSVDHFMKDVDLMFENAKSYNEDDSQIYLDAVDLQKEAHVLAEQEKQKPDSDYLMEDGRIPLPNGILHNGELWKVGDWVHISNPNDPMKPIVAQIYRTWQDNDGQKWVNACWYYRPEQTVHRYEKHFFENEVLKTGQYRDHQIEEVIDRCFVMFFTRFNKGRPEGLPPEKEVYVCEARYNEEKFKINKIKTWASCLPDEVREKDYVMDLYDFPKKMKKVPSPIKHLLKSDATEDDELPKPQWGAENAPPIVGAVHKRPREANESPPPEPTPSPSPEPSQVAQPPRQPSESQASSDPYRRGSQPEMTSSNLTTTHQNSSTTATSQAQPAYNESYPSQQNRQKYQSPSQPPPQSYRQPSLSNQTPSQQQQPYTPYNPVTTPTNTLPHPQTPQNTQQSQPPHTQPTAPVGPTYHHASFPPPRPSLPQQATSHHHAHSHHNHSNTYNPPRPTEVYTLPGPTNASIPLHLREKFARDEYGNVLFFSAPPLSGARPGDALPSVAGIGHSEKYLAEKARRQEALETRRLELDETKAEEERDVKRRRVGEELEAERVRARLMQRAMETLVRDMAVGTRQIYTELCGEDGWQIGRDFDVERHERMKMEDKRRMSVVERERMEGETM